MSIFDVFRGHSQAEANANWSADPETGKKAIEFNLGKHPDILEYLEKKGDKNIIGEIADTPEDQLKQREVMAIAAELMEAKE